MLGSDIVYQMLWKCDEVLHNLPLDGGEDGIDKELLMDGIIMGAPFLPFDFFGATKFFDGAFLIIADTCSSSLFTPGWNIVNDLSSSNETLSEMTGFALLIPSSSFNWATL